MKKIKLLFFLILLFAIGFFLFMPSIRLKARRTTFNIFDSTLSSLTSMGQRMSNFFSFYGHISDLKAQNEDLSNKIVEYQVDRSRIEELKHENELLKKELGFAEKNNQYKLISSRIIGREPTTFLDYIIIDKGEDEGIEVGMAVVSGGVLIGQIKEVYDNQAKVILITSKDSLVLAMLEKSRSTGILHGGISGLVLENIIQDIEYEPGEYVVTSGLDGQLPAGILIGTAGKIRSASSDLFKNISVDTISDLSNLELVFVLR